MSELKRSLIEDIFYPPHEQRKASAIYRKTHKHLVVELDEPCWICGIKHSDWLKLPKEEQHKWQLETHHDELEWAAANGVDLTKITADFHEIMGDAQKLREWLDSEGNMLVLCVPGDAPILLPNLEYKEIQNLKPGDLILSPDGESRRIKNIIRRSYSGKLIQINGMWMTPEHPILTLRGWLPAGFIRMGDEVGNYIRMFNKQMFDMRAIENKIFRSIISPNVINMMNSFGGFKGPPEFLFHNPAMLHNVPLLPVLPNISSDISLTINLTTKEYPLWLPFSRNFLQSNYSALIGTKFSGHCSWIKLFITSLTTYLTEIRMSDPSTFRRTFSRAGAITIGKSGDYQKSSATNKTFNNNPLRSLGYSARWSPVNQLAEKKIEDWVYDIEVEGLPSFITGSIIAHNCATHHRGARTGIHLLSYPAWKLQRWQGPDWTFIVQPQRPQLT